MPLSLQSSHFLSTISRAGGTALSQIIFRPENPILETGGRGYLKVYFRLRLKDFPPIKGAKDIGLTKSFRTDKTI